MARYALIDNNTVQNVIEWDGGAGYTPPHPAVLLNNTASHKRCEPGDAYDGTTFTKAPAPVPQSATPLQIRRVLRAHPQAAAIRTYFQGLTADEKEDWQFASRIRRDNALIAGMQTTLGATDTQIDNLFRAAIAERDD